MDLPKLKIWCEGLALYKVKTSAGYGEDKYVIASDFNDAAEKVRKSYIKEESEMPITGHINLSPKGKDIKIKEVELIAERVIL